MQHGPANVKFLPLSDFTWHHIQADHYLKYMLSCYFFIRIFLTSRTKFLRVFLENRYKVYVFFNTWFHASWFNVNKGPTRCNSMQTFIHCHITLHVSGVTHPSSGALKTVSATSGISHAVKYRLTLRRLMSYIYGAPILDVSRSHTTTQHSR